MICSINIFATYQLHFQFWSVICLKMGDSYLSRAQPSGISVPWVRASSIFPTAAAAVAFDNMECSWGCIYVFVRENTDILWSAFRDFFGCVFDPRKWTNVFWNGFYTKKGNFHPTTRIPNSIIWFLRMIICKRRALNLPKVMKNAL